MKKAVTLLVLMLATTLSISAGGKVGKHEEKWDFYLTNVDNAPSSIFLDLGYRSEAPINGYDQIVWISVRLREPSENGMSSSSELDTLNQIEDTVLAMMEKRYQSKYVGRLTGDGKRDFYFYMIEKSLRERDIKDAFRKFPSYDYQFGSKTDTSWGGYLNFLYPNPRQFQAMQNGHVLENLKSGGDQLTKARRVDHWIYFENDESFHKYKEAILKLEYLIQYGGPTKDGGHYKYMLQIYRVDHVDYASINSVTLELFDLATEENANYDGWETSVEK